MSSNGKIICEHSQATDTENVMTHQLDDTRDFVGLAPGSNTVETEVILKGTTATSDVWREIFIFYLVVTKQLMRKYIITLK